MTERNNDIEEARKEQGLTYLELAEKADVSLSTAQRYCRNGVKSPSVEVTNALHKALGMDEDEQTNVRDEISDEIRMLLDDKDRQILRIRIEKYICAGLAVVIAAVLIGLFLFDYAHPDRGWIRGYVVTERTGEGEQ